MRSATLGSISSLSYATAIPTWVRFVVDVITCADAPWASMRHVAQGFTSRRAAEAFARAMADRIPDTKTSGGCSTAWITVGAMHRSHTNPRTMLADGARVQWYRTLDHGGVTVKNHEIDAWYHGAPRTGKAA